MQNLFTLNNGYEIPNLGLGTFRLTDKKEILSSVTYALEIGYRHIDTAAIYQNENEIGTAIKQSGIKRQDIFITSKLWNSEQGYEKTLKAFDETLNKLQTDYLDLYLIHWAVKDKYIETWKAFEELYSKGVIKSIGVSNFQIHHLDDLLNNSKIKPAVNQIELHPLLTQIELRNYCNDKNIYVESWSPIAKGKILNEETLLKIAKKHNKTAAQIIIRWHIENNLIVIPKSATLARIKENFEVYDFKLDNQDILEINMMNKNQRIGHDPDNFNF